MGYDEILPHLGNFGKYQKGVYFLICLPAISCGLHTFVGVFLLATPHHRCRLPDESLNASYQISDDVWKKYYPIDPVTKDYSECSYFSFNDSGGHDELKCDSWIYDDSVYKNSAVTEFDLVCGKSFLRASADSALMIGFLIGSITLGSLSDKFGRKSIFFPSLVVQLVFGILCGLVPEYYSFLICKIVVGIANVGIFLVGYVISLEMVGPKYRHFTGTFIMIFFSCGYMSTAAFAYFIHDWRKLQIAVSLPGILFLSYWRLVPESIRWLWVSNKHKEATELIQKAAKVNGVVVSQEILNKIKEVGNKDALNISEKKPSLMDIFRYPNLRRKSFLICFMWLVISSTYYGLSWNSGNLSNNNLLNFVISGLVEIPAYTTVLLTLNRFGRRTILSSSMILTGCFLLSTMFISIEQDTILIVLAMLGKMTITTSYGALYVFSTEQFPTIVRNIGLGAASTFARFGGILAPYFILLSEVWKPLPMIVFGGFALVGGSLALLLPETLNKELPETIEDGESFGKKDKSLKLIK